MSAFNIVVYIFAGFGLVSLVGLIFLIALFVVLTKEDTDSDYAPPPRASS